MTKLLFLGLLLLLCVDNHVSFHWSTRILSFRKLSKLWERKIEATVNENEAKVRLDVYLSHLEKAHSRSFFATVTDKGVVTVNNKVRDKSYKVRSGDKVVAIIEEPKQTTIEPENIPLDIIYEDDHFIVVNKPAGMVVHPAVGSPNGTFVNALLYHLGDQARELLLSNQTTGDASISLHQLSDDDEEDEEEDDDNEHIGLDLPETPEAASSSPLFLRPGIVHRLDKGTSGLLIAGKHLSAVEKLSKLFATRKIKKVYVTMTVGHPGDTTIIDPIGRSSKNRQIMTAIKDGDGGREAITHTRTIGFDGKVSVVLVRIETGR
jgi:23S rRNA pseudouridine1911/1915/1917 synthase